MYRLIQNLHESALCSAGQAVPGRPGSYRLGDMRANARIEIQAFQGSSDLFKGRSRLRFKMFRFIVHAQSGIDENRVGEA